MDIAVVEAFTSLGDVVKQQAVLGQQDSLKNLAQAVWREPAIAAAPLQVAERQREAS